MQDNQCCGTCAYTAKCDGEFVCCNEDSENYALETAYDDFCEEYEEKEEN